MLIEPKVLHDLKTERPDVAPALPNYLRAVPAFFYGATLAGVVLSGFFLLKLQEASQSRDAWSAQTREYNRQVGALREERTAIEGQAKRASDVIAWVEGSRNLQPLVLAITRSMGSGSSILDLALDREAAAPHQIKLTLKLSTQGTRQLDHTLEQLYALNFRTFNPNQSQGKGEVDYQATLIWQSPAPTPPAARTPANEQ
jgi:hypothetical protein